MRNREKINQKVNGKRKKQNTPRENLHELLNLIFFYGEENRELLDEKSKV